MAENTQNVEENSLASFCGAPDIKNSKKLDSNFGFSEIQFLNFRFRAPEFLNFWFRILGFPVSIYFGCLSENSVCQ